MHRSLLPLTLAAFALAACEAPTTGLRTPPGEPSRAAVANDREDVRIRADNTCNGDVLIGTGSLHTVFGIAPDAGGGFHINFKEQFSNAKLTGYPSGASYVGSQETSDNVNLAAGAEETYNYSEKLIGQGQTPNSVIHFLYHITINANGEVTSFVDNFTVHCN